MSPRRILSMRRSWLLAAAAAIGVSISGCATSSYSTREHQGGQEGGREVADSNNDGAYVEASGITYQLQVSRQLNPYSSEDSEFLKGLPPYIAKPTSSEMWYGVFLWAKNQHHTPYRTSGNFEIQDTQANIYRPIVLDPSVNTFAWTSQLLQKNETEPGQDSAASFAFTQGKVLLFKLPTTVYDNRPLTLRILNQRGQPQADISLDL